jgi:hypothetical protein
MKDDLASPEAQARLWVPMSEAVRMIARFDGELLRSPDDIPPKAEVKLIEALRTGRVSSRGYYDAEGGELKEIPPIDWQECKSNSRPGLLRERGRRLPRFTNIEMDVADVTREFAKARDTDQPLANPIPVPRSGRPPGTGYADGDEVLIDKMQVLVKDRVAKSFNEAAWLVIGRDGTGAAGYGTPESKVKRLLTLMAKRQRKNNSE